MKTLCPQCGNVFDVPNHYFEKPVKCLVCKFQFVATQYTPVPITEEVGKVASKAVENVKKNNPIRSAWSRMPTAFKTAFLATFGVLSAIMITYYIYGHSFGLKRSPRGLDMAYYKNLLEENGLYRNGELPKKDILRGRALTSTCFVPDANKVCPYLELWTDDDGGVVGVSAEWYANILGIPAGLFNDSTMESLCASTCHAFEMLTKFSHYSIQFDNIVFKKEEDKEIGFVRTEFGVITVIRLPLNLRGDKGFYEECKKLKIDNRLYRFVLTAQNW